MYIQQATIKDGFDFCVKFDVSESHICISGKSENSKIRLLTYIYYCLKFGDQPEVELATSDRCDALLIPSTLYHVYGQERPKLALLDEGELLKIKKSLGEMGVWFSRFTSIVSQIKTSLLSSDGLVVVINDIDLGFHISHQRLLLPLLIELFPSVQFVVSTNSPYVMTSVSNMICLDLDARSYYHDLSAFDVSVIASEILEAPEYSVEIINKLQEFEQLIDKYISGGLSQREAEGLVDLELYIDGRLHNGLMPSVSLRFWDLREKLRKAMKEVS